MQASAAPTVSGGRRSTEPASPRFQLPAFDTPEVEEQLQLVKEAAQRHGVRFVRVLFYHS